MGSTLTVDNIVGATTAANVKLPAGSTLQTLEGFSYTRVTATTSTFVDSGVSVAITPKFTSSKVLVICKHTFETHGHESARAGLRLMRSGTMIAEIDRMIAYNYVSGEASVTGGTGVGLFIDSPSTTSSITYNTQFNNPNSSGTTYCNADDSGSYEKSRGSIIVMEISV